MKFHLILFCAALNFLVPVSAVHAQDENSLMSYGGDKTGAGSCLFRYYQAMGINPANLGIYHESDVVQLTVGFLDVNGLFFSDALPRSQLVASLLHGTPLTYDEKISIAQDFLETGNSFTGELMPAALVLQFPKVGGFGFTWRERMNGNAKFSHPLADIVFNGLNSPYIDTVVIDVLGQAVGTLTDSASAANLFNGSTFQYNWLREYNLSFGRKIIGTRLLSIYLGGSVKFMQNNAITDITFEADTITGFAAFSKLFDINYGNLTDPNTQLAGRLTPIGKGMGFDVGTTVSVGGKIFGAVSVTDIGSIKYKGNLVTVDDALKDSLINFIGINEADIFSDMDAIFNAEGLFNYLPASERTVSLPTQLRIGAGWHATQKFDFAFDLIQPLNKLAGNLPKTQYAALVNFSPIKGIKLSGGFTGGGFSDFNIPFGISFSFFPEQIWQISIGTGNILSILGQNNPTISLNLSLFRFHYE